MNDKYIVFKREDWEAVGTDRLIPVHDAVVIRRQDIFAPPALDAYANVIQAALSVLEHDGGPTAASERLQDIADYFHDQAAKAWTEQRKLPD